MKRFTTEIDQEFEIGGEVFRWMFPYWEDVADMFDREQAVETPDNGNGGVRVTVRGTIEEFINRIELFIDPSFDDGRTRWRELAKRRNNPVPHAQYSALYVWLLEVTSNPYPTEPSLPLEAGQPTTART